MPRNKAAAPDPGAHTTGAALAAGLSRYLQARQATEATPALPPGWRITLTPEAAVLEYIEGTTHHRYMFYRESHDVLTRAAAWFFTELAGHVAAKP